MLGVAQHAIAQTSEGGGNWYVSGSVGAFLRADASRNTTLFNTSGATGPGTSSYGADPGPVVNWALGYKLPLGFRIEGELGYAHYNASYVSPISLDGTFPNLVGNRLNLVSGGARDDYTGTVNALYDLPVSWALRPYVGIGVGVLHGVNQTAIYAGPGVPKFTGGGGTATNAVVLGEIGATYTIDRHWAVVPSYRFEHVFVAGSAVPFNANILKIGIRYSF